MKITRLTTTSFSRKVGGRMGSYLSFLSGALWHSLRQRPDVVVTLTTPPLLSLIGMAVQRFRGARHIIWEMDVYPDVAIELGVLRKGGFPAKTFGWLADLPRYRADKVIALGDCMRERLQSHGIAHQKIAVAENWSERDASRPGRGDIPAFPEGPLTILYSGNLGLAHDVETVAGAIHGLDAQSVRDGLGPEHPNRIRFVFGGAGSRFRWLQEFCRDRQIANTTFMPYCDRAELSRRLESGHIGLVTQKDECLGSAVPSKTYGIMSAGRPLLFIGPQDSTPARIIERYRCGWQIDCNDDRGLMELLRYLNERRDLIVETGIRARNAFETHYKPSVGVPRITEIVLDATKGSEKHALARGAWS